MHAMTNARKALLVCLCCAALAALSGPAGRMVVVLCALLFAPAYLFTNRFPAITQLPLLPRLAVLPGISISLVAIVYAWLTDIGIALTTPVLVVGFALLLGGSGWLLWRSTAARRPPAAPLTTEHRAVYWGLALLLGLTVWLRFYQIRNLVLPNWVDSVHHALLVRIATEQGAVPYSLQPYMPIDNLPYHWGYHVFTAAVVQLSGFSLPLTMLWGGQVLSALHGLTCAGLAVYLWRRPVAALGAAFAVGLLSIMPAYYTSWGRYTQLTGLLLVPALAIVWDRLLLHPRRSSLATVVVLLAGLSMVHVRVLLLAVPLLVALTLVRGMAMPVRVLPRRLMAAGVAVLSSMLLAAPWLFHLLTAPDGRSTQVVGGGSYNAMKDSLLWAGEGRWLVALALLAAFGGLWWWRASAVTIMLGWVLGMFVLANPPLVTYLLPALGAVVLAWAVVNRNVLAAATGGVLLLANPVLVTLPYLALVTNEVAVISVFLPASILIGGGGALVYHWLAIRSPVERMIWQPVALIAAVLLVGWATWQARDVVNMSTTFVTAADLPALEWAAANTPDTARFLINAQPWFPNVDRGSDGGWWLLPLTGRWTSTPPAIYDYGPPEYVDTAHTLSREIATFTLDAPEQPARLYEVIEREGITHVYLGQNAAPVTVDLLRGNAAFAPVYEHNGVTIFAVRGSPLAAE